MSAGGLVVSKHEAAGNDFLVLSDLRGEVAFTAALARALCDRHLGVGADGAIRIRAHREGIWMDLRNADGSVAEMSGNGIRCAVQAAIHRGAVSAPRVVVETVAGRRAVEYRSTARGGWASVAMGPVVLGEAAGAPAPARRSCTVEIGNPHVVAEVPDPEALDLEGFAAQLGGRFPQGVNVEVIAAASDRELVLRVWERGAGPTLACGTGSCAAAAAARSWGLVGDHVMVRNPGGTVDVMLPRDSAGQALLAGPVRHVADISLAGELGSPPAADPARGSQLAAGRL